MLRPIAHRGPDGQASPRRLRGLGHCRLSIIDLSTGDQPMATRTKPCDRLQRRDLQLPRAAGATPRQSHQFKTQSDTEVIIHAYESMALIASATARDVRLRDLGPQEPPAVVARAAWHQTALLLPDTRRTLLCLRTEGDHRRSAVSARSLLRAPQFFSFFYLPGEDTLFRSVRKLLPATIYWWKVEKSQSPVLDLPIHARGLGRSFEDVVRTLRPARSTVRDHMIADVLSECAQRRGRFLAVPELRRPGTEKKVKTFTVGLTATRSSDERPYARMAAPTLRHGALRP